MKKFPLILSILGPKYTKFVSYVETKSLSGFCLPAQINLECNVLFSSYRSPTIQSYRTCKCRSRPICQISDLGSRCFCSVLSSFYS